VVKIVRDDFVAFMSGTVHGNMSYNHSGAGRVLRNRLGFIHEKTELIKNSGEAAILRGFIPRFECGDQILTIKNGREKKFCGSGMVKVSNHIGDAVITNSPNIFLGGVFADCLPIILFDEAKKVISLIHASRQGTMLRITEKTIHKMVKAFGVRPHNITAYFLPCICSECYELEIDVDMQKIPIDLAVFIRPKETGKIHFELAEANRYQLQKNGIAQVVQIKDCTACSTNGTGKSKFFSYYRATYYQQLMARRSPIPFDRRSGNNLVVCRIVQ